MLSRADAAVLARHLIDVRGRADRRAMGIATLAMLTLQFGLAAIFSAAGALDSLLFLAINIALLWIGGVVLVKRLRDIGWSGWWIPAAFAFWLVGALLITLALMVAIGPMRFQSILADYAIAHTALVVALSLPPFGGLLWLQACAGTPGANRFGPVPGAFGFSHGFPRKSGEALPAAAAASA